MNQRIRRYPYRYKFELSEREFDVLSRILVNAVIKSKAEATEREKLVVKIMVTQPENKVYH